MFGLELTGTSQAIAALLIVRMGDTRVLEGRMEDIQRLAADMQMAGIVALSGIVLLTRGIDADDWATVRPSTRARWWSR